MSTYQKQSYPNDRNGRNTLHFGHLYEVGSHVQPHFHQPLNDTNNPSVPSIGVHFILIWTRHDKNCLIHNLCAGRIEVIFPYTSPLSITRSLYLSIPNLIPQLDVYVAMKFAYKKSICYTGVNFLALFANLFPLSLIGMGS